MSSGPTLKIAKLLIGGGFGAGKTTFVGSISDVMPLVTERPMTEAAAGSDPAAAGKATTTVAMDFGRITLEEQLVLFLFGLPGQRRFWFAWPELCTGAVGAVVLADVNRLADAYPVMDFFEGQDVPYVVALNTFPDRPHVDDDELRQALSLERAAPVLWCDARDRGQVRAVLIAVVQHAIARHLASAGQPHPSRSLLPTVM